MCRYSSLQTIGSRQDIDDHQASPPAVSANEGGGCSRSNLEKMSMKSRNMVPRMAALVIQDFSPIDLDPMTALLRQFGFEVVTASDGETGLKIASTQSPDVIISDAVMPDMSGAGLRPAARTWYKPKNTTT